MVDDPDAMRGFFATLCGAGAPRDRFPGLTPIPLEPGDREAGRFACAGVTVPQHAAFFEDHFPRRPVFPGTLLLDCMTTLASGVVAEAAGCDRVRVSRVTDVKLRAFTEPGAKLDLRATVDEVAQDSGVAVLEARAEGMKRPVGGARVRFSIER